MASSRTRRHSRDRIPRRGFMEAAAAGAAFAVVPRHALGGAAGPAPSDKTTLACIGMGGQGHVNLFNLLKFDDVRVTAVCDVHREGSGYISWNWMKGTDKRLGGREPARILVDEHYAGVKGRGASRGCRAYADYRVLLENEDIDAVMVAVPDHSHAVVVMAALKQGKHVYCEKPLAWSVEEARLITAAARKAKVATQLGNQSQAGEKARLTQEFILDGAIGAVREVHLNLGKRFWDPPAARPTDTPPVPGGLDWDRWLGPAPARPYHPAYHPWRWRDWIDFGTSPLGDMGCHKLSTVFKALKLAHPIAVAATLPGEMGSEIHPRRFRVRFDFPARGDLPPVTVTWHDEGFSPPRPKKLAPGRRVAGTIYIGEKGTLMGHRLVPESRMKEYGRPPRVLSRSRGQYREWVDACRGGAPAGSDFVRHSGLLSETPLLGNIAMRAGRKIAWDGPNMKITNDAAADQLVRRTYRDGWTL